MDNDQQGTIKTFSTPRLSLDEKLYVRVYLSTLSHAKAYEAVKPGLVNYSQYVKDNSYLRRENVSFYISLGLQEKAEALSLSPELILEKLYKEATREGAGSNHAARIQALTQLGKYFGLFEEKRPEASYTFNIINYSSTPLKIEEEKAEAIEHIPSEVLEELPELVITNYKED